MSVFSNLSSLSIICCHISGNLYLSFGIPVDTPTDGSSVCAVFVDSLVPSLALCEAFPLILSGMLFPIKSPVASAIFWIAFF